MAAEGGGSASNTPGETAAAAAKEGSGRSAREKEKTKLRERQRRSITTRIFQGLRQHGGYRLSPRADINQVLRELAREAGWIVDPDGTTYRSKVLGHCPLCAAVRTGGMPTPASSVTGGAGGDCSTTASPRRVHIGESLSNAGIAGSSSGGGGGSSVDREAMVLVYGQIASGSGLGCPSASVGTREMPDLAAAADAYQRRLP